jgi:hypothetical protein
MSLGGMLGVHRRKSTQDQPVTSFTHYGRDLGDEACVFPTQSNAHETVDTTCPALDT